MPVQRCKRCGSLAIFAAILLASSFVSNFAADQKNLSAPDTLAHVAVGQASDPGIKHSMRVLSGGRTVSTSP
jgi:hypothetical protein